MTEKRYIRNIVGQIYDCKDDKWVSEDWDRLTLEEDDEVVELLNKQHETIISLRVELDTHKHPLWSTREAERIVNELKQENEKLKQQRDFYYARLQKIIKIANGDLE